MALAESSDEEHETMATNITAAGAILLIEKASLLVTEKFMLGQQQPPCRSASPSNNECFGSIPRVTAARPDAGLFG